MTAIALASPAVIYRIPAPGRQHTVEYTDCMQTPDPCDARMRVFDRRGSPIKELTGIGNRFEDVFWTAPGRIARVKKISPSAHEYIEIEALSGRETQRLLGLGFMASPDLEVGASSRCMAIRSGRRTRATLRPSSVSST
jgi:hypothetical protein